MNPEKKLKLILASLKDRQIVKFFEVFNANFSDHFKKTIRQISFNCYESVCEFKNKVVSGYGKNSQESYVNSVRTLIELLADDVKLHQIMRQSLRIVQQLVSSNCQSQKKLVSMQKESLNSMKNVGVSCSSKPMQKRSVLKEEIFEYLNLDNLKISNPNTTHKTKAHDKYMSQTNKQQDYANLQQIVKRNKQLQEKLAIARQENLRLKQQIKQYKDNDNYFEMQQNIQISKMQENEKVVISNQNTKIRESYEGLKTRTNDYLNISEDTKILQKSKLRSVSVEASQTQKYVARCSNDKKIVVPKLNLQVLPNYHGKSNKSLNQSLMEVYEKTHLK